MTMAKPQPQPSHFYRLTLLIEVPDGYDLYTVTEDTQRLIERRVENAVDDNTGMLAYTQGFEPADAPEGVY